jgi:hypothetical protein
MAKTERRHPNRRRTSSLEASVPLRELIEQQIFLLRGHRVMLSNSLAGLYEVEPRALVQAVKRNIARFPDDFMFQLNEEEFNALKSQIVISSWGGMRRANPYVFSEQGVAMLSQACCEAGALFRSTSRSCEPLYVCAEFSHLTHSSAASSMPSRRNTTVSSKSSSMQFAN